MKKQTSLITLSLLLATPALAGGAGAPVAGSAATGACRTITQIVSTDPQFSTLLTAVQAAGLADMLTSGQYTVFAPTNAAFAKLPSDQLAAVLNDADMLRSVLRYHVVAGKVTSKQVMSLTSVKTAQGATLTVGTMGNTVMIGGAHVTRADVAACNGVIHVIDTVLMPPAQAAAPAVTGTAAATTSAAPAATVAATPAASAAVDITSIPALPLSGATVGTAATSTATTAATTTDTAAATTTETAVTTTTDTATATTTDTAAATTSDTAAATTTETTTETAVETTTTETAAPATNTLYDVIVADARFSTLRDLLSDAGLTEMLTSGEYTIFAPTNDAFNTITTEQLAALLDNPELLRRVLSYHVIQGRVSAEQLTSAAPLTTGEGSMLTPSVNGDKRLVGTATISETVSTASNGTIYVIDQVLMPPAR